MKRYSVFSETRVSQVRGRMRSEGVVMMNRSRTLVALVAAMSALTVTFQLSPEAVAITRTEIAGLSPTAPALVLGPDATVLDGNASPTWYAMAEAYDSGTATAPTRPVFGGYVTHTDGDGYSTPSQLVSANRGLTFSQTSQEGYEASTRLDDGRVIQGEFLGQTSVTLQQRTIKMRYSDNDGATFPTEVTASLNIAPQTFSHHTANFFPTSMVQVPGGLLLMAGYGILDIGSGTGVGSALLMQSSDGGASWTLRSTVAQGSTALGFSETAIALTSNGQLLAVSRSSSYDNLWERRSTTLGSTWTTAPQGIPEFAKDSSGNRPFGRINPRLALLPNGILALVAGRPDNHIALSYDGTGNTWDVKKNFYHNHDTANPQDMNEGSSANADFAWTEANRAVLLADTCHAVRFQGVNYNKCTWHANTMSDGIYDYQIKRVMADVLTADTGKIDLAGKVSAGTVSLGGNLGTTVPGHPRTGNRGAVDGSNEAWSSAVRSGGGGTFDITLDRTYALSKVGLSLAIGGAESATVQTRVNPTDPWSTWYTTTQTTYALRYSTGLAPRSARYVRVLTGTSSVCPTGVAAPCSLLNEIELYANDVDSFENDPVNGIPRGYSVDYTVGNDGVGHQGVWASQATSGSGSGRVARIVDDSGDHLPALRRTEAATSVKTVEFRFHPDQWRPVGQGAASAFLFGVLATPVGGARQVAYHLAIWHDGTVRFHNGSEWRTLGTGPALNPSTSCTGGCIWNTVRVRATTTQAVVSVNGTAIGTATRFDRGSSSLVGHQFSASSTADAAESFVVDDIYTSTS